VSCALLVRVTPLPFWVSVPLVLLVGALSREASVPSAPSVKIPILVVNARTALLVSVPSWVAFVCLVLTVNLLFLVAPALTVVTDNSPSRVVCANLVLLDTVAWRVPLPACLVEQVVPLLLVASVLTCALMV